MKSITAKLTKNTMVISRFSFACHLHKRMLVYSVHQIYYVIKNKVVEERIIKKMNEKKCQPITDERFFLHIFPYIHTLNS